MRLFLKIITALCLCSLLSACDSRNNAANNIITIGTIAGPETELVVTAKKVAKKEHGLNIHIVEFSDYALPNAALSDGSLDANIFQHAPYLETAIQARHYALTAIGKTFVYPIGIYSHKIKNLKDIPAGAVVAIPNDPSNEARALLLLEKAGLIKLSKNTHTQQTVIDVIQNPHHLQLKELDAAQLPRVLDDVNLAVINTNYAVTAGLIPTRDALFLEGSDSPYANLIVVRTADKDSQKLKWLVEAMHSDAVKEKAKTLFQGQAIPAWQ